MDDRYRNPQVTALWDLPWTYDAWWRIEQAVIRAQIEEGIIDRAEVEPILQTLQPNFNDPRVLSDLAIQEVKTKHDVAAFVKYMREWLGSPHGRWIHFGLTSSDLVDTAQGMRFRALHSTALASGAELVSQVHRWRSDQTIVVGRTHGQPAEPTTIGVRAAHWAALVESAMDQLLVDTRKMAVAKIAGPVGTYAHNPPTVEARVASTFSLAVPVGASQIVPRGDLGRWANSAAELVQACAKVAMDFRLMNLLGEADEPQTNGQVGSSSMSHKNNPIRAEQVAGLARLAAGYASMLQPLDLWLERDISNSCVERVAVPDLWHVVLHAIDQTTLLLSRMELNTFLIRMHVEEDANALYTCATTLAEIRDGMEADEARAFALEAQVESYDLLGDIRRDFLSGGKQTTS
jgi:adenylosuccinate lyase